MTRKRSQPPTFSEEKKQHIRKDKFFGKFFAVVRVFDDCFICFFLFHHQSDQSTLELFFDKRFSHKIF